MKILKTGVFKKIFTLLFAAILTVTTVETVFATSEINILKAPEIKASETSEVLALNIGKASNEIYIPVSESPRFEPDGPAAFAVDTNENFYILDTENFKVVVASKDKIIKVINYPEGESGNQKFFIRDISVSSKDGKIYLLNHTLKNIFVYSSDGKLAGDINIAEYVKSPHKIFAANDGNIYVRDEDDMRIVVFSADGKFIASKDGSMISNIPNNDGFLFALGEFDKDGRDILLMDIQKGRDPKVFGRLLNSYPENQIYDYQIIGTDDKLNLFAMAVEQVKMDVSRSVMYKFDITGKLISRFEIDKFWGLGVSVPTRQFTVSPAGNLYVFDSQLNKNKFVVIKIEEK
ncbi:MAG TPA: hypothetical protein PKK26_12940 [Candidatus Wallbacteria bacterium]|mgnify:CR=1 FL=1|nr:hypothetical protein [Candidatus Wallbacteria bacterium]